MIANLLACSCHGRRTASSVVVRRLSAWWRVTASEETVVRDVSGCIPEPEIAHRVAATSLSFRAAPPTPCCAAAPAGGVLCERCAARLIRRVLLACLGARRLSVVS